MNLFATVLTYPAPSANYRGESEQNRSVIQKITEDRLEYPVISPEAMRNALREILAGYGLPCNRSRLHDEEQLVVQFQKYPHPNKYVDDFFFGYMVAKNPEDRKKTKEKIIEDEEDGRGAELRLELRRLKKEKDQIKEDEGEKAKEKKKKFQTEIDTLLEKFKEFTFKRDSVLRMNLAKSLHAYRHNSLFTQSPLHSKDSPWQNDSKSALLHRETVHAAFQYPFALNLNECRNQKFKKKTGDSEEEVTGLEYLLKAIGELNGVAGNHARSYYEMAPASIVIRLSNSLVAGYNTYGFTKEGDFPEVTEGIPKGDYPGHEFYIGGKIVKGMPEEKQKELREKRVTLCRNAQQLIRIVSAITI